MPLPDHTLLSHCPLCHGQRQALWHRKDDYDVVRCLDCEFIFTRDYPSADFLRRCYELGWAEPTGRWAQWKPKGGVVRRLKYWLFARWVRRFYPKGQVIRMLEIGCSQGDLLQAVQGDPRFEARGLDFADPPLAHARSLGLRVDKGDLRSMNFADASFDLIVALHVLEHVHDLDATFREIRRVLRPNGLLFAVCPCVTHIKARWAGARWKYLGPPSHLWYFSPATLSRFLEKAGFSILHASGFYHRAHVRVLARKQADETKAA
jgi:SAM-dependent methyltransferase